MGTPKLKLCDLIGGPHDPHYWLTIDTDHGQRDYWCDGGSGLTQSLEAAHVAVTAARAQQTEADRIRAADDERARIERARIEQSNDIAHTVITVAQDSGQGYVPPSFRYGIADALWAAGYRKTERAAAWEGPMPGDEPQEIDPGRKELDS